MGVFFFFFLVMEKDFSVVSGGRLVFFWFSSFGCRFPQVLTIGIISSLLLLFYESRTLLCRGGHLK